MDEINATVQITLDARSGYQAKVIAEISPNQWRAINLIIDGDIRASDVIGMAQALAGGLQ